RDLKEESTLARYIGSIGCLGLFVAGWWMLGADRTPTPVLSAQSISANRADRSGAHAAAAGSYGQLDRDRAVAVNWPRLPFGRHSSRPRERATADTTQYRETARRLLRDARTLARRGDFSGALRLVDRAASFPVKWAEGEESPQVVREQIERMRRHGGNGVDAFLNAGDAVPQAGLMPQRSEAASAETPQAQVARLMKDARRALRLGMLDQAEQLVQAAQRVADTHEIRFAAGQETPQRLLREIAERRERGASPVVPVAAEQSRSAGRPAAAAPDSAPKDPESRKQLAQRLLAEAREDIRNNRLGSARAKALQAQRLNVSFGLFEERPEHVLADIARLETQGANGDGPSQQAVASLPEIRPARRRAPMDSPAHAAAASQSDAEATPSAAGPLSPKEQAKMLLRQAREDLRAGRLAEARRGALEAQKLNVEYDLFEDRPEHILAEIARRGGELVIPADSLEATASAAPPASPEPTPARTPSKSRAGELRQRALQLLAEARQAIKAKRWDVAREKALEAQRLGDVAYGLFDDRPELVLADLKRLESAELLARNTAPKPNAGSAEPPQAAVASGAAAADPRMADRQRARQLLQRARAALKAGRLDEAARLAQQAEALNLSYGLFDDRPDLVLADIRRAAAESTPQIAERTSQPDTSGTDARSGAEDAHEHAQRLLRQARTALRAGQLALAEQKAKQAAALNVQYGPFDDRPQDVLAEIARRRAATKPSAVASAPTPQPVKRSGTAGAQTAPGTAQPAVANAESPQDPLADRARREERQRQLQANRRQALQWLREARAALRAGDAKRAEQLARQAQKLEVNYGVLDDRPERVLAEIEKLRGARDDRSVAQAERMEENRHRALTLLREARDAIKRGDLQTALQKAKQAQQLEVVYGVLDDRPDLVLADIGRIQRQRATRIADADAEQQAKRDRAIQLLAEARADLAAGRIADAERKVAEAEKLDVAYRVWDDRPELVRRDIQLAKKAQPRPVQIARDDRPVEPGRGADLPLVPPAEPRPRSVNEPRPLPEMPSVAAGSDAGSGKTPAEDIAPIAPQGVSALDLYNQGIAALRRG
ncbi:MAG: hypothetical protein D6725_12045, partial [Planctomycetota bacterium]